MESKNGLKICEGISCSSYSVKELDVIIHKNHFLISPYSFFGHSVPHTTSESGGWSYWLHETEGMEWNGVCLTTIHIRGRQKYTERDSLS